MKKGIGLLLFFFFHSGHCHDIRIAVFEIFEGSTGLEMRISADRHNFIQTLKTEFQDSYCEEMFGKITAEYLLNKMAIEVDGHCTSFEVFGIEYSDENIFIQGTLNLNLKSIYEVKMTNTFMIDIIKGHDNIMKLKLNDRSRSFRLNSKRTSTVALYND